MLRVGFTGTSDGMTPEQKEKLRHLLASEGVGEFHHGDCVGADAEAHDIAVGLGYLAIIHPPDNPTRRAFKPVINAEHLLPEKPYLKRNYDIALACSMLIATPKGYKEQLRGSGTWSTVRYARKLGKFVCIINPNGVRK